MCCVLVGFMCMGPSEAMFGVLVGSMYMGPSEVMCGVLMGSMCMGPSEARHLQNALVKRLPILILSFLHIVTPKVMKLRCLFF